VSSVTLSIAEHHVLDVLAPRGLDPEFVSKLGVYSIAKPDELPAEFAEHPLAIYPALVIPWHSPTQGTVLQLRPDVPLENRSGDPVKYLFPTGSVMVLNALRPVEEVDEGAPVILQEGTFQSMTCAKYAPKEFAVYGISGCWSWRNGDTSVPIGDLSVVEGRDVLVSLDADAATNLNVYNAGQALAEALKAEGALSVRFLRLAGAGSKAGLDDVLGARPEDKRAPFLARLIESATAKPADVKPKARKAATASPFFEGEKLQVATLAKAVVGKRPAALTQENKIALYMNGVYRIDGTGFRAELTDLLGESYRTTHETNTEAYTIGQLAKIGAKLPDRMNEPLINCRNTMVDLRTGEAVKHDPRFFSTVQVPIDFDPAATCPVYDAWAAEQIGDQLEDLEESVALMLDPTVTPTKAVFLFGLSRSGKSTYLRLLQEIAGPENYSAVTLHQLADDKFAAANLYGKMLNVAADLSAAHVEDISIFKMMTGEDPIHANRKYGSQFAFVNRALFAFSANELPTVGESSRAYSERVKPFFFGVSFAGREDPSLEAKLRSELPGILNRLIAAHRRRAERGHLLATDERVREMFEMASDRVRQFVHEACEVLPVTTAQGGTKNATVSSTTDLYRAFQRWAADEGRAPMAKSKVKLRLSTIPGVVETISSGKSRGWNVRVRPQAEWGSRTVTAGRTESDEGSASDSGTLSVSDHPAPDVDSRPRPSKTGGSDRSSVGKDGSKRTKFQPVTSEADPLDAVIHLAEDVPAPVCPDCDRPKELVPPVDLWFSCRHCAPETFTWS
jgi:putative DNA primase/helicase